MQRADVEPAGTMPTAADSGHADQGSAAFQATGPGTPVNKVVLDFVVEHTDKDLLEALEAVSRLTYPIANYQGFREELLSLRESASLESAGLALEALTPLDFPIEGLRSAFEKLLWRLQQPSLASQLPAGPVETTSVEEIYKRTFGLVCGGVALAAYEDAIEHGMSQLRAVIVGQHAGEHCSWRPSLRPSVRPNRPHWP